MYNLFTSSHGISCTFQSFHSIRDINSTPLPLLWPKFVEKTNHPSLYAHLQQSTTSLIRVKDCGIIKLNGIYAKDKTRPFRYTLESQKGLFIDKFPIKPFQFPNAWVIGEESPKNERIEYYASNDEGNKLYKPPVKNEEGKWVAIGGIEPLPTVW